MKKSALMFLVLTGLFKAALCDLFGWNFLIPTKQTWSEARKYCREHYTDLTSISNQEEDELLATVEMPGCSKAWTGLYKDADDTWKWSGGKNASFFNWSEEPKSTSEQNICVVKTKKGWLQMNCEMDKFCFYCFQSSLVLVKKKMTWEEAMKHCRDQFTDLVSLPSESALVQALQASREAHTDHVWIGLRYLADTWLWVDGGSVEYQAWNQGESPQCSAWSGRCGALSLEEEHWDSRDCAHKLNFVCF